eukprot:TRINITY_DN10103_c0_g1_i1.p1 TRINITY_DN10103_c0_g1~~TRINITY_DN10103_c0_g1_i1.p1  ORF type:complete len:453 (-),score=112.65 TRINITY_DN10103_c0_g1_i1:59-1357(-)
MDILASLQLDDQRFISLLEKLISHTESLQNNPPKYVPQESLVGDHVLELLEPHSTQNGGPLIIERLEYVEGRNNILITLPSKTPTDEYVSFVGSHMDVVMANPVEWDRNPFELTVEGDNLHGRGTTDCLGHVAMITDLFLQLVENGVDFRFNVVALFIASEEKFTPGVGVDAVKEDGKLDALKNGPLYWVDSADSQPCIGTGAANSWTITAHGKKGHSAFPQNCVNPIILAYESVREIIKRFHQDFPQVEKEIEYGFTSPSTFKPTLFSTPDGSVNQIQETAWIKGDIRVTPFYDLDEVKATISGYVDDINADVNQLETGYELFKHEIESAKGTVTLEWDDGMKGIASDKNGKAFKAIDEATKNILGDSKPYSVTGTLPLVGDLQADGYDIVAVGFGKMAAYHATNEYCTLSGMQNGFRILADILRICNEEQ